MALGPELVYAVSEELLSIFGKSKIRKVESSDSWIALTFHRDSAILLSWDNDFCGCCEISPSEIRELANASSSRPPILEAIKAHLVGTELTDVLALNRDRIIRMEFKKTVGAGFYQTKYLLLEACGRYSNIILLDEELRVLEAAKHINPDTNRYRSILPGCVYTPPPLIGGVLIDDFDISNRTDIESIRGIGRPLIQSIKKSHAEAPDGREILDGLELFKGIPSYHKTPIYQSLGGYITLYPYLLQGAETLSENCALRAARRCTFLPLLERYLERYRKKIRTHLTQQKKVNDRKITETEKMLDDESAAESLLLFGKLILSNSWLIKPHSEKAELTEWTEEGEVIHIVTLDPLKDAARNAEGYFTKYKKRRAAIERARRVLPSLVLEREEIDEQFALLECHTESSTLSMMADELMPEKKRRHGRLKQKDTSVGIPYKKIDFESAGASIYVGLSAKGNHYVTFRLAKSDDIWLHAQNIPGAHVILRFSDKPSQETYERILELAAACAAYYSKARGEARVRVDYTERKHVRAIKGGGPAHVTYKEFSSINANTETWAREQE